MPFLFDTCAISEFVARKPDPSVVLRLRALPPAETFIPTMAIGEVKQGIDKLPQISARRAELEDWLYNRILPAYQNRLLSFNLAEALIWGQMRAKLKKIGKPMETEDSIIAAVALTHHLTLVTRNDAHFLYCGVATLNPWK